MLGSDLCDYSDAYVWVKRTITVTNPNNNVNFDRRLTLKNNAPFISCVSKINGELLENAEDLDIVIPMYNLLEYSKNYEKTSGYLTVCFYHVTYAFQSESTLYSCLNVKELLARQMQLLVKCTVQISTHNTAQSFGQLG